jgi:hypothetical protein
MQCHPIFSFKWNLISNCYNRFTRIGLVFSKAFQNAWMAQQWYWRDLNFNTLLFYVVTLKKKKKKLWFILFCHFLNPFTKYNYLVRIVIWKVTQKNILTSKRRPLFWTTFGLDFFVFKNINIDKLLITQIL